MNNQRPITYLILIIALFVSSCQAPAKKENKNVPLTPVARGQKYPVDTLLSVVTWKGAMLVGANSHTGYVNISKGELRVEKGQVAGGTVEVNMHTIEDNNHESNNNLIDHLKNADFFDVMRFPFSTIDITRVSAINEEHTNITGNLTIKGITHPVTFPVKMEVGNGIVKANGRLVIDRTKWGVNYKSGKFFDLLANQIMSDSIEFHIKLVAKKADF